jgi:2-amino-4-hydroxy-6-hydroxymethyldihydropteridine diphosphokinase
VSEHSTGVIAYIALGSNLGDRRAQLAAARASIADLPGTRLLAESTVEETAPLGGMDQPAYLNQMVAIETTLEPRALLDALQAIEAEGGRVRTGRWEPRTIDLDLVMFDQVTSADPGLTLPHPGLGDRDFWQRELAELEERL